MSEIKKLYVMKPNAVNLETILHDGKSIYCSNTIETYNNDSEYVVLDFEEASQLIKKNETKEYLTDIHLSNEDRYWNMLEALPPLRMFNRSHIEGFLMSELTVGDITSCYICYKEVYYSLSVRIKDSLESIVERIDNAIENNSIIKE